MPQVSRRYLTILQTVIPLSNYEIGIRINNNVTSPHFDVEESWAAGDKYLKISHHSDMDKVFYECMAKYLDGSGFCNEEV